MQNSKKKSGRGQTLLQLREQQQHTLCIPTKAVPYFQTAIMFLLISLNISFFSYDPLLQIPSGSTDCTLPITWATENDKAVDMFIILTNNPLWTFTSSPVESLKKHRQVLHGLYIT